MKKITIIGGGASGTLLAVNLLKRRGERPVTVGLVDRADRVGLGVAYSTDSDVHVLNVPAGKMGAFPDDLEHFHRWLDGRGHDYRPSDFVPRRLFGEYLRELLASARNGGDGLHVFADEAVDIKANGDLYELRLLSGERVESDVVVFAFGNFLPPHPTVPDLDFTSSEKYFRDPWQRDFYEMVGPDESVFMVGTGLSMVDVVLQLKRSGHTGRIRAISTRGLLPAVHRLGFTYDNFYDELAPMRRITDVLKAVRRHAKLADANGSDWRAVIDSLRPHTQRIWLDMPAAEKQYFRQHLSRYWNVARHRMPPDASAELDRLRAGDKLEIMKGRLTDIRHDGTKFNISYRSDDLSKTVAADVLVNCIGSETDFSRIETPLIQSLLRRGLVRPDDLRLGLNATPDGNIIGDDGNPSRSLFTLGTALRGVLWESTAIPEIRLQARDLADRLLAA
jgi:uncharacterized NAD(P)/FAD-binding protein YdhS